MRKLLALACGALVMAAVAIPAVAGVTGAHFVGDPSITTSGNTLTVSGKAAGLGNVAQIHASITADAQCINPGDNKPRASNKQSVAANGDFPVQNGKAEFELTATASFQPNCSPPMTVEFSNLHVTVTAPGVFLTYP